LLDTDADRAGLDVRLIRHRPATHVHTRPRPKPRLIRTSSE
jgi:hypothetical protein